jgi:uncharacterized membrane protein YjdF
MVPVIAFVASYVIALFTYGRVVDSPLTNIYTPITVVLVVVLSLIHRSTRFSLPVLWALAVVGMGNMAGGVLLIGGQPLYVAPLFGPVRYDKIFHFGATAVAALASWAALKRWSGAERITGGLAMATVMIAGGAGAIVEIVEFSGTLVFPGTNVGDYGNNMLDLVANLAGAMAATALIWWRERGDRQSVRIPAGGKG